MQKISPLSANSISVTEGLFIYIYYTSSKFLLYITIKFGGHDGG